MREGFTFLGTEPLQRDFIPAAKCKRAVGRIWRMTESYQVEVIWAAGG